MYLITIEGSIEAEFYAFDDKIKKIKENPILRGLGPNYHIWAFGPKIEGSIEAEFYAFDNKIN